MIEFSAWPKIPRLNRDIIITEKIDGTNGAVIIDEDGNVGAQSRNRLITPDQDNQGFAAWVASHADQLRDILGPGRHFGEWWGSGIQRGYGLPKGRKVFSLFNTSRWAAGDIDTSYWPDELDTVPVLYHGKFSHAQIQVAVAKLRINGSHAAPFMNPEGIVIYHTAANMMFKVTLEGDEAPKSAAA